MMLATCHVCDRQIYGSRKTLLGMGWTFHALPGGATSFTLEEVWRCPQHNNQKGETVRMKVPGGMEDPT